MESRYPESSSGEGQDIRDSIIIHLKFKIGGHYPYILWRISVANFTLILQRHIHSERYQNNLQRQTAKNILLNNASKTDFLFSSYIYIYIGCQVYGGCKCLNLKGIYVLILFFRKISVLHFLAKTLWLQQLIDRMKPTTSNYIFLTIYFDLYDHLPV